MPFFDSIRLLESVRDCYHLGESSEDMVEKEEEVDTDEDLPTLPLYMWVVPCLPSWGFNPLLSAGSWGLAGLVQ